MAVLDRWNRITELVERHDFVSVEMLCKTLGISEATVRRDLKMLEAEGKIIRLRGGAKAAVAEQTPGSFEANFNEKAYGRVPLEQRTRDEQANKRKIAKKAASLVQNGDFIYLDSSSTVYCMLDYLQCKDITVVTGSVPIIYELMRRGIETVVIGGRVDGCSQSIICNDFSSQIEGMNIYKAFLGCYAANARNGYLTYDSQEGAYKQMLIHRAECCYMLVDETKFARSAFYRIAPMDACTLITNRRTAETEGIAGAIFCDDEMENR